MSNNELACTLGGLVREARIIQDCLRRLLELRAVPQVACAPRLERAPTVLESLTKRAEALATLAKSMQVESAPPIRR
jgi:hypothetical protein